MIRWSGQVVDALALTSAQNNAKNRLIADTQLRYDVGPYPFFAAPAPGNRNPGFSTPGPALSRKAPAMTKHMIPPATRPITGALDEAVALTDDVIGGLRETAEEVIPWFLSQMPQMYFQDTNRATQVTHLRAIIAAKASNRPIKLTLRSEDGGEWTSMRPSDYPGVLAEIVQELPDDRWLRAAKIHTAMDGNLVLDTFEFGDAVPFDPSDAKQAAKLEQTIEYAADFGMEYTPEEITAHFHRCSAEYVLTLTPLRLCNHLELFKRVSGTDGSEVTLEPEEDPRACRIVVAAGNATTRTMLERIAIRLSRSQINIRRAYLDVINDEKFGWISILGFVVNGPDGKPIDPRSELWEDVRRDLARLKWLDQRVLELSYRNPSLNTVTAEIIVALCHMCHQVLVKRNPFAFNPDRLIQMAERNFARSTSIAKLFLDRFDPEGPTPDGEFEKRCAQIHTEIDAGVDLEDARALLHLMVDAVRAVYRTNVYLDSRYAIGMRIDPAFLQTEDRKELPFGVFFVHGRSFNGFHVRFRDIARGGVRAVRPSGVDQHAREAERLYDEVYQLAFAQQLKNKDIPEGGAKAAMLIEPGSRIDRSVKAFVDTIIDLITPDESVRKRVIDRFGREELLYLGPDENITPDLIDWIVERAKRRGYSIPTALMSSKPGAGINHKEYGVTSEGVTVFLEVALNAVGIDPRTQPFTVKMTGGPDGDVGGNMINIMHREFGSNAKIIGIADGSGAGEDPNGLDHQELLRLFKNALPIAMFDRAKLSKQGRVVTLDEVDGVMLRNTLHNRLVADAFVPCGGRPNAIHGGNWQAYLQSNGTPSSKVIVEGANLFLNPEAREELTKQGVLIFKDSSANKCGVICSSFEIISCMLLDEQEFLKIKPIFVEQVLEKLRTLARREAELLVRVHDHMPHVSLPKLSVKLSEVMMRTGDAIAEALETLPKNDMEIVRSLVLDHLPKVLLENANGRVWTKLPETYLHWMMAKSLAGRIVYREGFEYLQSMAKNSIAELALKYLQLELERRKLSLEVAQSNLASRERIAQLLDSAGILSTITSDGTRITPTAKPSRSRANGSDNL